MRKKGLLIVGLGVLAVPLLAVIAGRIAAANAPQPDGLGLQDGGLAPCPDGAINCVGSQSDGEYAAIEPLAFSGDAAAARERLTALMADQARTELVTADDDYLHYVARSLVFGFPDDVEFQIGDGVIHVRSASRLGVGDMGVNRARIDEIRAAWEAEGGG